MSQPRSAYAARSRSACGFRSDISTSRDALAQSSFRRTLEHQPMYQPRYTAQPQQDIARVDSPKRRRWREYLLMACAEARARLKSGNATPSQRLSLMGLAFSAVVRFQARGDAKQGTKEDDGKNNASDRNKRDKDSRCFFFDIRECRSCSLCTWLHREQEDRIGAR